MSFLASSFLSLALLAAGGSPPWVNDEAGLKDALEAGQLLGATSDISIFFECRSNRAAAEGLVRQLAEEGWSAEIALPVDSVRYGVVADGVLPLDLVSLRALRERHERFSECAYIGWEIDDSLESGGEG